jgi:Aminopeptidase I zinc metalloprotease (M18)
LGKGNKARGKILFYQVTFGRARTIARQLLRRSSRNQSSLLAFTIPPKWQHGVGLSIVATHVDSPNLKVRACSLLPSSLLFNLAKIRPVSKRSKAGYLQVGVETYGGGIWHSWLDRDLSLAGRIVVADKKSGIFSSRLIKIDRPVLRIPTLAIHRELCQYSSSVDYRNRICSRQGSQHYLQVQSRDRICPHPWSNISAVECPNDC